MESFSQIAEPLHMLKQKHVRCLWGDAQQTHINSLRIPYQRSLSCRFQIFLEIYSGLQCEWYHQSGSSLSEEGRGLGTYSSRLLSPTKKKYSIREKECLSVVYGCEKYHTYLEHMEFCLHTDNQALAWLLQHAKELCWIRHKVLHLALFKFKVCHISGRLTWY
jgi:hypothetical protein